MLFHVKFKLKPGGWTIESWEEVSYPDLDQRWIENLVALKSSIFKPFLAQEMMQQV